MSKSTTNAFDDVRQLNISAKDYLATAGRTALEVDKFELNEEQQAEAQRLKNSIERDVRQFAGEITAIEKKHAGWPSAPKRESHYTRALQVGNEYVELIDKITNTTTPLALDLADVLAAGVRRQQDEQSQPEQQDG